MTPSDKKALLALLPDVCAFYRQDFSKFLGGVWLAALDGYTFDEVKQALERHTMNPDTGQFMPKPADVVKMLTGTSADVAMVAWSKVERAIRTIGQYQTVVFDDPLLHRVVYDMGGWVKVCTASQTVKDLEFAGKEFQARYRGFSLRSERPEFPAWLEGHAESQNALESMVRTVEVRAIGDVRACAQVLKQGTLGRPEGFYPTRLLALAADIKRLGATPRRLGNNDFSNPEGAK